MYRALIIAGNAGKMTAIYQGQKMGTNGIYEYGFDTVMAAKEAAEVAAKQYLNVGLTALILDDVTGYVLERSLLPKVPVLKWESV